MFGNRLTRRSALNYSAHGVAGIAAGQLLPLCSAQSSVQRVPETSLSYYLVAFDKNGRERSWPDGLCTPRILQALQQQPVTDVFIFSHGWMGDIPQAKIQYNAWISAMAKCQSDIDAMKAARPDFSPLMVGIHWPSLPFGDEELRGDVSPAEIENRFAERFPNTPRVHSALKVILSAARGAAKPSLSPEVVAAFKSLQQEGGLRADGPAAPPGTDSQFFNPQELYQGLKERQKLERGEGTSKGNDDSWYNLLYMLAAVSFWTMKDRARRIGENSVNPLLSAMQSATAGKKVRFHLMGHSFGCIVASAAIQGPARQFQRVRPVSSVSYVQGALSLWSFAGNAYGKPGHFRPLLENRLIDGPIITTQSSLDYAVGYLYPFAAGVARQVHMAKDEKVVLPKFGAVGTFGIQGDRCEIHDVPVLADRTQSYNFKAGAFYNIDCSSVIKKLYPVTGAHSDISHPEVAHAIWEAALVGAGDPTPKPPEPVPQPVPPVPQPCCLPTSRRARRRRR